MKQQLLGWLLKWACCIDKLQLEAAGEQLDKIISSFLKTEREKWYKEGRLKGGYSLPETRSKCCNASVYIQCYDPEPGYHCSECNEHCNNPEGLYFVEAPCNKGKSFSM